MSRTYDPKRKGKSSKGKCPVSGKGQYKNARDADNARTWISKLDPTAKIETLHSYLCPYCRYWHVGHRPQVR